MATYKSPKPAPIQPAGVSNNKEHLKNLNQSVVNNHSNDYPGVKTSGIKIRGTGCATKGVMARGPMA